MDTKKIFSFSGFPSHLISDEDKEKEAFGLQMAKAIEYEWFYRPTSGSAAYYDSRDKFHKLRLYARGEQDSKIYKDLMNGGEDSSYINYDWRPLQIIPKFMKLIVNQMTERLFKVKAEATDSYSTNLKDTHRKNLETLILARPAMEAVKKHLNIDLMPENIDEYPESQEELDLYMQLKYKPAIEIAAQLAIQYTLDVNDYSEIQSKVIEDVAAIGIGAIKHTTDPTKGIVIEYVDPANLVYSYSTHRNFKDVHYYGEVKRITINELKRLAQRDLTDKELQEISESTSQWSRYHNISNSNEDTQSQNGMVDVLFFNFKSTNTLSYKKKFLDNGGFKMTKRESTFTKKDKSYTGYDVEKKVIDVWYEGVLVLGSDKLFSYKLCENMIRPKGLINKTAPNYIVYAPDIYQNRPKGLVETVILYVDEMQQIHIKLQQIIAKARPNGIYIDVTGLSEIELGDGNFLTPLEAIKIYDETGNVLGGSTTAEGEYNYGREPIKELKNGVIDGLDRLISAYNHYLNLFRDAIGIPQGSDASMPHPDTLVGVQNQVAANSNTATRHILDSVLNITERLGKGVSLRISDIFEYSDLKEVYTNSIGTVNVKILEALRRYHLHDLGINIELKPDAQEKQMLEANIAQALQQQLITLDDAIDIREINEIKLANQVIKIRRIKREKQLHQAELEKIKAQGEAQAQAAQASAQAAAQTVKIKSEADLLLVQAKSKAKMDELIKEGLVKSELMQKEFDFNMQLNAATKKAENEMKDKIEDNKTKRQDRGNSQASEMIEQRTFNKPAKSFESSEDNISGSIEMGELEPS